MRRSVRLPSAATSAIPVVVRARSSTPNTISSTTAEADDVEGPDLHAFWKEPQHEAGARRILQGQLAGRIDEEMTRWIGESGARQRPQAQLFRYGRKIADSLGLEVSIQPAEETSVVEQPCLAQVAIIVGQPANFVPLDHRPGD